MNDASHSQLDGIEPDPLKDAKRSRFWAQLSFFGWIVAVTAVSAVLISSVLRFNQSEERIEEVNTEAVAMLGTVDSLKATVATEVGSFQESIAGLEQQLQDSNYPTKVDTLERNQAAFIEKAETDKENLVAIVTSLTEEFQEYKTSVSRQQSAINERLASTNQRIRDLETAISEEIQPELNRLSRAISQAGSRGSRTDVFNTSFDLGNRYYDFLLTRNNEPAVFGSRVLGALLVPLFSPETGPIEGPPPISFIDAVPQKNQVQIRVHPYPGRPQAVTCRVFVFYIP